MKRWTLALSLIVSQLAFAGGADVASKFASSELVQDTIRNVEREHSERCAPGKASALFPKLFKKVTYTTRCGKVKVKIKAKFKNVSDPVFRLTRVKVWNKGKMALASSEEFSRMADPFLVAYKQSQLVRDVRHFVEDSYEVVCKQGRVRKGIIGGKANYFYFAKCKGANRVVKIKLKSRVHVFGDRFRFDLTKYKLTFK